MLHIATLSASTEQHPLEEHLHQQLTEHGYTITETSAANVLICMGMNIQGFDASSIQQIESQFVERFLGAELFLLARAFPFARIRVGLNAQGQLLIASPLDESTLFRLIRLLDQYKRLNPVDYESKMGGFADLPAVLDNLQPTGDSSDVSSSSNRPMTPPLTIQHSNAGTTLSWQDKLEHWQLRDCEQSFSMPPELGHAGIQQVLKSTTQFQSRQDPMGQCYGMYGFPDLVRSQSRVLLVTPDGGVIAMHRKQASAILSPMVEDLLFSLKSPFPRWAMDVLENKLNGADRFALEGSRVYGKIDRMIHSATVQGGSKTEGTINSTIASVLLQWSSR